MSVIAGILTLPGAGLSPQEETRFSRALDRYPHDEQRDVRLPSLFLTSRTRWITPQSYFEPMPWHCPEQELALVYDGVIDNREELFRLLQAEGSAAHLSDGELLLLGYRKWGRLLPGYLCGDYAFLLWDGRSQTLFGARDPIGTRTLYYTCHNQRVAFCSTIAPLLQLHPKRLNEEWLAEFMAISHMYDAAEPGATPYEGVRLLPPGHTLTADLETSGVSLRSFASFEEPAPLRLRSNGEYEEAFTALFEESVRARIRARRQVGVTLSGGLDSGSVAALASRQLRSEGKTLYAYSSVPPTDFVEWTPGNRPANERPYIEATVRHAGNMEPHYLAFEGRNAYSEIDDWLELLETPYKFVENAPWIRGIYEAAHKHDVGLLLTGTRGNHAVSWGPALDYYVFLLKRLRWYRLGRELSQYGRRVGIRRARLLQIIGRAAYPAGSGSEEARYAIPPMIRPEFAEQSGVNERIRELNDRFDRSQTDIQLSRRYYFTNPLALNVQGISEAKLSYRYGIMERDPTADLRLVRFCLSLPLEQFVQNGVSRSLIRRTTRGLLPDEVRLNQRVRGMQGADWLFRLLPQWASVRQELEQLVRDPLASPYFHTASIRQALDAIGPAPRAEDAFQPGIRFLMRSLVVYRFLQRF